MFALSRMKIQKISINKNYENKPFRNYIESRQIQQILLFSGFENSKLNSMYEGLQYFQHPNYGSTEMSLFQKFLPSKMLDCSLKQSIRLNNDCTENSSFVSNEFHCSPNLYIQIQMNHKYLCFDTIVACNTICICSLSKKYSLHIHFHNSKWSKMK